MGTPTKIPPVVEHGEVLHTTGNENDVAAAIRTVERLSNAKVLKVEDPDSLGMTKVLVLPKSMAAHSLQPFFDEQLTAPRRRKGTASVDDVESFVEHVNRFKDDQSALFVNQEAKPPTMTAVLNYHRAGGEGDPRFGDHRTLYKFPISDEWKAWTERNAKTMSQAEFAEFIEDRILDITSTKPKDGLAAEFTETLAAEYASASKLLELSRGLSITVGSSVRNAQNLATGEVEISYSEEHSPRVKVPQAFLIAVPVFKRGDFYTVPVRLRYRTRDGAITWFYEMYRPERIVEHAVKEAAETAKASTNLPLFFGSPE
jgi:uncharacterized protein YfdQ (DUF2303 family)